MVLAGFVVGEGLLAARLRDRTAPVVVVLDAAALEPLLGYVPRLGDRALAVGAVERHRGVHLLLHGLGHLFAEHVAQDASDEHRHENKENQNEVLKRKGGRNKESCC